MTKQSPRSPPRASPSPTLKDVIAEASAPAGPISLTEDDVDRLVAMSNARAGVSGALLDDLIWRRAAATSEGRGWVAVCSLRACSQLMITP